MESTEEIKRIMFHVTLEQAEDGWIVAECPALPGCVSQGKDEREALENIKEAITAWLWAEDQKAMAALADQRKQPPVVVAVRWMGRLGTSQAKRLHTPSRRPDGNRFVRSAAI